MAIMAEDLKGLIEKIHEEGVIAAENKAKDIEKEAKLKARSIVDKAEKDAEKIIARAKQETSRIEKSGETAIKQAARNTIIALKKEIGSTLDKLISLEIRAGLTPEAIAGIIPSLIRDHKDTENADIVVSLSKEDLKILEKGLLKKLKDETGKGITLKARDDIGAGFAISYDSGRSHYDFTDKALAEYIGSYLRPKLNDLLKTAKGD